jgi:hypothetical protein
MKAIVRIKTTEGAIYIGKLCRHFKHKIEANYEGNTGVAHFPAGICHMLAEPDTLIFEVDAHSEEGMQRIQGTIDRHLIKFAFREELVIQWETVS